MLPQGNTEPPPSETLPNCKKKGGDNWIAVVITSEWVRRFYRAAQLHLRHSHIMKKKSTSQSAFFHLRILTGLFLVLAGVFLALMGFSRLYAQSQQRNNAATKFPDSLVPAGFDCSQIHALGIDMQENLLAGAIMIYCGEA